jgi:lysyl-tRNA synthetase class 2
MNAFSVLTPCGKEQGYLQTSPEYAMKSLLCEGAPDIFQLSKMFRAYEVGSFHLCEFTMLEWYRLGMSYLKLADEVCELLNQLLGPQVKKELSYKEAFLSALKIDPLNITTEDLRQLAEQLINSLPKNLLRDNYLTLLFSDYVEPTFNKNEITVIHSFPASQASLARLSTTSEGLVADRFEVFCGGMELANGFSELSDPDEQLKRFEDDNRQRKQQGLAEIPIDTPFMELLRKGLPSCSGVALGVERLMMIKFNATSIDEVVY